MGGRGEKGGRGAWEEVEKDGWRRGQGDKRQEKDWKDGEVKSTKRDKWGKEKGGRVVD